MSIVTFETAKRLKEAGFPQPEFAAGQFWYNYDGELFVFTHGVFGDEKYQPGFVKINGLREVWTIRDVSKIVNAYFAPDAMRIMLELYGYTIGIGEDSYYYVTSAIYWEEDEDGNDCYSGGLSVAAHENPAESAAIAWLSIYEK